MIILWLVTGASLVASLVALIGVRRASRRLEEFSHLYWELKYQQSELRTLVQSLGATAPKDQAPAPPRAVVEGFVPLSAIKR